MAGNRRVTVQILGDAKGARKAVKDADDALGHLSVTGRLTAGSLRFVGTGLKGAAVAAAGLGVAGGAALVAFGKSVVQTGIQYQDSLNNMQAVTHSTDAVMAQVAQRARDLGNDLTLPATSAADAANAMVELAKGNLTAQQAMAAAKGTLQLAAAAQIDGAQAATIQADALNAFGLQATNATHVADVLANAANAATGEITDFAQGLQASSAVAHTFGIGLDDTVTALALLANAGIKGSDAGTSLKTTLIAMASPSKNAAGALKTLGVNAFDAHGNFIGLEKLSGQLADAQGRLTKQAFNSAAAIAFGTDGVRTASVLANAGAQGFDKMAGAIGRQGGAAQVAAARTKGLGGAIQGFQSQVETLKIDIFAREAPHLEAFIRLLSDRMPKAADAALHGLDSLADTGSRVFPILREQARRFAPAVEQYVTGKLELMGHAAQEVGEPALRGIGNILQGLIPQAQDAGQAIDSGLRAGIDAAGKIARQFEQDSKGLGESVATMAGSVGRAAHDALPALRVALSGASGAANILIDSVSGTARILSPLAGDALLAAGAIKGLQVAMLGVGKAKGVATTVSAALDRLSTRAGNVAGVVAGNMSLALTNDFSRAGVTAERTSSRVTGAVKALGVASIGAAAVLPLVGFAIEQNRQETERFIASAAGLYDALRHGGEGATVAEDALQKLGVVIGRLNEKGGIARSVSGELAGGLQKAQEASNAAYQALSPLEQANSDVAAAQATLAADTEKYGASSLNAAVDTQQLNFALARQQSALDAVSSSLTTTTDKVAGLAGAQAAADSANAGYDQSLRSVRLAQEAYNDAVTKFGPKSQQAQDALSDLKGAQAGAETAAKTAADAARNYAIANDRSGDAAAAAQKGNDAYRGSLNKMLGQLAPNSPLRKVIEGWIHDLDSIPREIVTHIAVRAESASGAAFRPGNQSAVPHLAAGGPVTKGRPYIVGDAGRPELFVPNESGRILPRVPAMTGTSSGGGQAGGRMVLELRSGGSRLDDVLVEVLRKAIKARGGDVQVVLGRG